MRKQILFIKENFSQTINFNKIVVNSYRNPSFTSHKPSPVIVYDYQISVTRNPGAVFTMQSSRSVIVIVIKKTFSSRFSPDLYSRSNVSRWTSHVSLFRHKKNKFVYILSKSWPKLWKKPPYFSLFQKTFMEHQLSSPRKNFQTNPFLFCL
jgi:hypothetical protein